MRVLHLNTYSLHGGAARSARRLAYALIDLSVDSRLLSLEESISESIDFKLTSKNQRLKNIIRPSVSRIPLAPYGKRDRSFSFNWISSKSLLKQAIKDLRPDILHLHWVGDGFVRLTDLMPVQLPIIMTLHDAWFFTGGCHVPDSCHKWLSQCGQCPALNEKHYKDPSYWGFQNRLKVFSKIKATLIAPSPWILECAQKSPLFNEQRPLHIPNGLNAETFKPLNKIESRKALSLPEDKRIVLFAGPDNKSDDLKGYGRVLNSLNQLPESSRHSILLVVVGGQRKGAFIDEGINVWGLGNLYDDFTMTLCMNAADLVISGSKSESFGNVAAEAQACGTPTIGFSVGGLKDVLPPDWQVPFPETKELSNLVQKIIFDSPSIDPDTIRKQVIPRFDIKRVAHEHLNLYKDLLRPI